MTRAACLMVCILLAGCGHVDGVATLPAGVTQADVTLYKTAVADAGCTINTPAEAAPIAAQTGFDREKLMIIAQYLVFTGESQPTETGFRLISGTCANA